MIHAEIWPNGLARARNRRARFAETLRK
jgi:hypothetical protein